MQTPPPGVNRSQESICVRNANTATLDGLRPAADVVRMANVVSEEATLQADDPADGPADGEERGTFVASLARGLSIMRAFTAQQPRLTLAELARLVGLPRASVRRSLLTLQALGYVESDGRQFSLSPQVLALANAYLSSSLLPRVAQPFVERVSDSLGESCSLSIQHGRDVIYVARSSRRRVASLHRDVGTHLPAHCTSMGRVLLAGLPEVELDAFLRAGELHGFTPFTVTDPGRLRDIVGRVRRDGYCIVDQELEIGLRSVAVPVLNAAGRLVAAMNVGTQAGATPSAELRARHLPALRAAAADLRPLLL